MDTRRGISPYSSQLGTVAVSHLQIMRSKTLERALSFQQFDELPTRSWAHSWKWQQPTLQTAGEVKENGQWQQEGGNNHYMCISAVDVNR